MVKTKKNVANTTSSLCGTPRRYRTKVAINRDINFKLKEFAVPLGRQLVGQQLDGVNLNNGSLLNRQFDDEFGVVDPACDIHTDTHMLQDAMMRDYRASLSKEPAKSADTE